MEREGRDPGLNGSDDVFRRALRHSGIGTALVGPDGSFLEVNAALCDLLGRDEDALMRCTWQELTHPDDLAGDLDLVRQVLEDRRDGYRLSKRYLRPDGSVVHGDLTVAAVRDAGGAVRFFVSQILDETEQVLLRERYRLLAENSSDVIAMGDNDGILRWVSPSVTAFLGWDPDDLRDRPFIDLIEVEDRPAIAGVQQAVLAGRVGEAEARMRHADGGTRWSSIRVKPVVDESGQVIARVGAWWDVSERRQAQVALAASEERLRAALDAEIDAHVFLTAVRDDDGSIVDFLYAHANAQASHYLRRAAHDLVGHSLLTLFPGQGTSGMFDRYRAVVETGEPLVLDGVTIPSEIAHEERSFDFRGVRFQDSVSLTWRDVTDRVRAEEALALAEERYRIAAENATDIVIGAGSDGRIAWAFGSLEELLGIPPASLVGQDAGAALAALLPEADESVLRERQEAVERGQTLAGLVELRRPDGSTHWFDRRTRAVIAETGSMVGVVVSLRDAEAEVVYRRALEESERQARDLVERYEIARNEALEANLAKTAFLSRMSHELRTPLNSVLGYAQLLAMDPLTEDQREAVQSITMGGRHLLDLISEILDISRIEAGRLSLSMEPVDVANAVHEAIDLVRTAAEEDDIVVAADVEVQAITVWADRQRVIQILINLLSNAIKYNHPGGRVDVTCTVRDDGLVAIGVTDTGIGIPEDVMPRLYEPFDRLGVESTGVEGTGIGLALSRGLAMAMGGRLEAESEAGRGSTFSVLLRAVGSPEQAPLPRPIRTIPVAGRVTRILYIEDNPANMNLMRRIAGLREGAELDLAPNGATGLQRALASPPDLVLLDLHLPDIPGEEILRRLRAARQTTGVPVVVVTADASPHIRRRMLDLGAMGVLHKPVDVSEVLAWIDDPAGLRFGP